MIFKLSCMCIVLSTFICHGEAIKPVKLNGKALTPVLTPFKTDGSLDLSQIPNYAQFLRKNGVKMIWVLGGSSGEASEMNLSESISLLNAWLPFRKYFIIIVEVGFLTVRDSCKFAKYCEALKITAITYTIPTRAAATTPAQAASDFKNVADCAPKTPVYYYYASNFICCSRNPSIAATVLIIIKQVPNFAGVIAPVEQILQVRSSIANSKLSFIVFFYYSISTAYLLRFDGYATPLINVIPECVKQIDAATNTIDILKAQDRLDIPARKLCLVGNADCRVYCPNAAIKAGLLYKSNSQVKMDTRRPYCPVTPEIKKEVFAILKSTSC